MWGGEHGSRDCMTLRYGRAPEDAPPAKSDLVEAIRSKWFKLHWILNAVGLSFAASGAVFSYLAGVVRAEVLNSFRLTHPQLERRLLSNR